MSQTIVNNYKLITQSLVMTESEEHILEYHIYSNLTPDNTTVYGITIWHFCNEKILPESATAIISSDEYVVLKIISFLSSNFVFPCHLQDIIQDYKYSNRF